MNLAESIRAVIATSRRRPSDLFPFYMLGVALPAITQTIAILGGGALLVYLWTTSRLTTFQEEFAMLEEPPGPEASQDEMLEWSEQAAAAFDPLITLPSVGLLAVTILGILLSALLFTAIVSAGQLATCFARLRDERGMVAGIAGVRKFWLRMTGLYLLEFVLWIVLTVSVLAIVGLAAIFSVVLAIFVGIFAGFGWLIGAVVIRAIFVFAPVALIVRDTSVFGALRESGGYIRGDFVGAVSYYAIAIGLLIIYSGMSGSLAALGAPTFAPLLLFLVITPFLDLLKTTLFGDHHDLVRPPDPPQRTILSQGRSGLRRGLRETATFVRTTGGYHAAALAIVVLGFVAGWITLEPLLVDVEFGISERVGFLFAPTAPLYYFGNNWTVMMSIGMAGLALTIPSLVVLAVNGFVLAFGIFIEPEPLELLAFVVPHGIFEFPALLISGALGLYLGIAFWKTWRGRWTRERFATTLQRSFWVLVGIGILLAIAAVIEGWFSPYYYRPFL